MVAVSNSVQRAFERMAERSRVSLLLTAARMCFSEDAAARFRWEALDAALDPGEDPAEIQERLREFGFIGWTVGDALQAWRDAPWLAIEPDPRYAWRHQIRASWYGETPAHTSDFRPRFGAGMIWTRGDGREVVLLGIDRERGAFFGDVPLGGKSVRVPRSEIPEHAANAAQLEPLAPGVPGRFAWRP